MNKLTDMMKGLTDLQGTIDSMGERIKDRMKSVQVEGVSAAGMVKITLYGDFSVKSVYFDEVIFSDGADIVSDLVKAALEDALSKLKEEMRNASMSDLPLPDGFKLPF